MRAGARPRQPPATSAAPRRRRTCSGRSPSRSRTMPPRSRPDPVARRGAAATFAALCLLLPAAGGAQAGAVTAPTWESPARYEPLNPMMVARTGLFVPARTTPTPDWRLAAIVEYGSVVERNLAFPDHYLLDAELLRVQLRARRGLGRSATLELEGGVVGATAGFGDAFFERYHELIQWVMEERDARPRNEFGDRLYLVRAQVNRTGEPRLVLPADLRATVSLAHDGGAQSVFSLTVPTTPSASRFSRGVATASVVEQLHARFGRRVTLTASGGLGWTPRTGELSALQRTFVGMASGGAVVRIADAHAAYATLLYHTAPYRETRFPELDMAELSVDFGYRWRTAGGRQWRFGLTEDTRRRDPGIDLILKVSVE